MRKYIYRRRNRLLSLITLFCLLVSMVPGFNIESAEAAYPDTKSEFLDYVKKMGLRTETRKGRTPDYTAYKKYNKITYNHNDDPSSISGNTLSKSGNKCQPSSRDEWRYFGTDANDVEMSNYCFRDDKGSTGEDADTWDFNTVEGALTSWDKYDALPNVVKKFIKETKLQNYGANTLYPLKAPLTQSKIRLDAFPTWYSKGSYFVRFTNNSGQNRYATLEQPTLPKPSLSAEITTDKNTYRIPSSKNNVSVEVEVSGEVNPPSQSQYFDNTLIASLKAGFDPTGYQNITAKDYTSVSKKSTVTKKSTMKLDRSKYKPGTYNITLEGSVVLEPTFRGENMVKQPSKTIKLVVDPLGDGAVVSPDISTSPKSVEFNKKDIPVEVKVSGEILNLDDASDVKSWTFYYKIKGSATEANAVKSKKSFTNSNTFSTHMKAKTVEAGMKNDKYTRTYEGRVVVTLADGSKLTSSKVYADTVVYKKGTEPPPVDPPGGGGGEPEPEPEPEPIPPVANLLINSQYYWPETVYPTDNSYDTDGTIVDTSYTVDGGNESPPFQFDRVTEPESHNVTLTVTDDDGLSDQSSKVTTILPTTPVAEFSVYGFNNKNEKTHNTGKVNRMVEIDATLSSQMTLSSHIFPIAFEKTTYDIKPLTEGIEAEDILIRQSSDKSMLRFLVRKPGDFEVTVTVTNSYGETSREVTKKFTILPDVAPIAKFTVDRKQYYRDPLTKEATITLTDLSESTDNDIIAKKNWYMEFDSNNDGLFGTPMDRPKEIISRSTANIVKYKTKEVGNYRFSLDVQESFGQPTLPEFIEDFHYLKDDTEPVSYMGSIEEYQKDENFNVIGKDVGVEVNNTAPFVDFGVKKVNKIDIKVSLGTLETASLQHLTGSGANGGTYDHYYYSNDVTLKNNMIGKLSNVESNLKTMGLDAELDFHQQFMKLIDPDGICERQIPVWGWTEVWGYDTDTVITENSSYSPSGGWYITNVSTVTIPGGTEVKKTTYKNSRPPHNNPCAGSSGGYSLVNSYVDDNEGNEWIWVCEYGETKPGKTEYHYSLRRDYLVSRTWEIQYRYDNGCNATESVDTTDFSELFTNNMLSYRQDADKYFIQMDRSNWSSWQNNSYKMNSIKNKLAAENIHYWGMSVPGNKLAIELLYYQSSKNGQYTPFDFVSLNRNATEIENYYYNRYVRDSLDDGENITIVLGDKVSYDKTYTDAENDPELQYEWRFTHDNTKINKRTIDNAPLSPIGQSGLWVSGPVDLNEVGTYTIRLRSKDNPLLLDDYRFYNYQKWSDDNFVREKKIHVHRAPIADFRFKLNAVDNKLDLDPTTSYDPDHQFNMDNKGIVEYKWLSYTVDDVKYEGAPPEFLQSKKIYDVTLRVKDIDGAYATVTKKIVAGALNEPPVARFDVQKTVQVSTKLNFEDMSYDPNGDELQNYKITIRRVSETAILKSLTDFPESFKSLGLTEGDYVIGLTVQDVPKLGPPLTSELFEQKIKVVRDNRPPVSNFTMTPSVVIEENKMTYKDLSTDPDNDPLINYSWKVERLGDNDETIEEWVTGNPPTNLMEFNGIGRYRITQTVFDDPPSPLLSLSDTHSIIVEMVPGPKNPFASFQWWPEYIVAGNTFTLDPVSSFDLDGEVVSYSWKIMNPRGAVSTTTEMFPKITNAIEGIYDVELHVFDNDGLRSKVPAKREILVNPLPPNIPPVADFYFSPFNPKLGDKLDFNPDASYDIDGEIVSYRWEFTGKNGAKTYSNEKYPNYIAAQEWYDAKLTVTDDRGATDSMTKRINVDIKGIKAFVTHTETFKEYWVKEGEDPDTKKFLAGEKFMIEVKTTPAREVWGSVQFGGKVGLVNIPKNMFTIKSKKEFEYTWVAELWREDFETIKKGNYIFNFHAMHPDTANPTVQSDTQYGIQIVGNIYDSGKFHRNY